MQTPQLPPDSEAHMNDLIAAMAIYAEATNRMEKLTAKMGEEYINMADEHSREYAELQTALDKASTTVRDIAGLHPEWFPEGAKTVSTLYGDVQSRTVTSLEVPNEEVTIQLLRQLGPSSEPFLRVTTELNREALEVLSDQELARIRVSRVEKQSLSIKLTKPKPDKAVKAAAKRAKKKEAQAAAPANS